jgi:hypothetical protein
VLPTRAASHHLMRTIENDLAEGGTVLLPDFVTREELHERLFERTDPTVRTGATYTGEEREALLGSACRAAIDAGVEPPFRVRPGLIAAMLEFFDALKRHQKSVDDFERLTLGRFDGGTDDKGAQRLVRQTRFFAAAFREFERLCGESGGVDEHAMRERLLTAVSANPWRHIVVAVRDRAADRYGLYPVDWDLLARIPGLVQLDVVVTDTVLAGPFHERIHQWLPGIEEVRLSPAVASPLPPAPCPLPTIHVVARDRDDEVAGCARRIRDGGDRQASPALDRIALVVRHPLPYVYLAREVFRSVGVPCQMFDALPLAGEPYAAAVDLLFSFVSANYARVPAIALLRSPHFRIGGADGETVRAGEVAALDRALSDASYLGGIESLDRLVESWQQPGSRVSNAALRGALALQSVAHEVETVRSSAPIAAHLDVVLSFLAVHDGVPGPDDPPNPAPDLDRLRARQLRARGAVLALLRSQRDAYRRFDSRTVGFEEVAAMVRRGIESRTFAPRLGESGVHIVDADSAPFGDLTMCSLPD